MRPYIICHMVESVDGRIDCDVMEKIDDTNHYYDTLDSLNCDATIEGRVTLDMHYAEKSIEAEAEVLNLSGRNWKPAGKQVYKAKESERWAVGVDTKGSLAWGDNVEELFERPLIMILCEDTDVRYLEYLKSKGISYITTGDEIDGIDLEDALETLSSVFGVKRLAIVGGGHLNGTFLHRGLIDEISMLYASGIDAREGMAASFDGRSEKCEPIRLNLVSVEKLDDLIWAKYTIRR